MSLDLVPIEDRSMDFLALSHNADGARVARLSAQDVPALIKEIELLRRQLAEALARIEGWERIEDRISEFIPEHYEAGSSPLEDWAKDANGVVSAAHAWRKRGRTGEDGDKLDAAVEKIYPTGEYL